MSIEHNLIPAGEQHVVANWQVATVPDLDNLTVTFADIGKQAWVQGTGTSLLQIPTQSLGKPLVQGSELCLQCRH